MIEISFPHNFPVVKPFWNFAQTTKLSTSYFAQNFETIGQLLEGIMEERDFARFEFNMNIGGMHIITTPWALIQYKEVTLPVKEVPLWR